MVRIATFRKFTHPELEKIGVPGGRADEAFLTQAVSNTNRLIREKLHIPPVKETHSGRRDGAASGWVSSASTDAETFFSDVDFTPTGKQRIADRDFRFLSSSFRRDFALTGEPAGAKLPGVYLDHVAILGADNPAVKGLTDLSEIQFSESDNASRSWIVFDNATNEITLFSEMAPTEPEEDSMPVDVEARLASLEAKFTEQSAKVTQLEADKADLAAKFTEADTRAKTAEAKLKETNDAAAAAKFSEFKTKVADRVKKAQQEKKLGAEKATALLAKAEKVYGDPEKEALFAELLDNLAPVVPTKKLGEGDAGGEDGKGEYGASSADFAEMDKIVPDPEALARVHAATGAYMAEHDKVDYLTAQAAVKKATLRRSN